MIIDVNLADLRKKQLLFSMSESATDWIVGILKKKAEGQLVNLKRLAKRKPVLESEVDKATTQINAILKKMEDLPTLKVAECRGTLMGYEGTISRSYFQTLDLFLPPDFKFQRRSRRPAMDYFNASLNYLYGMTYGVVEGGVFAKGLDPAIGILHADAYKSPTLVFDLIEPTRPLVDWLLIELILENRLIPDYFIKKEKGYWVHKKGKRILITSFNDLIQTKMEVNGSRRRLKDHIYMESNNLGTLIDQTITLS